MFSARRVPQLAGLVRPLIVEAFVVPSTSTYLSAKTLSFKDQVSELLKTHVRFKAATAVVISLREAVWVFRKVGFQVWMSG
jgi:hypothetical protein